MVMTRKPLYLQGPATSPVLHPAEDTRLNMASFWTPDGTDPLKVRSGIVWGPGETASAAPLAVSTPAASQVQVTRGRAVIQGTTANSGAYVITVDAVQTRTIPGASLPGAGQFKAGYVIVHVYDTVYGDAQDGWDVELIVGAAASTTAGAAFPTVPNSSLVLRNFTVDSAGNLTLSGTPAYTVPNGDPVPCTTATFPARPWNGAQALTTDTGELWTYNTATSQWEGGWASYTPTWATAGTGAIQPALGNGTLIGRYRKQGRRVDVRIALFFGSTTGGGSGIYTWSVPFTSSSAYQQYVGTAKCFTTANFPYTGHSYLPAGQALVQALFPISDSSTRHASSQNAAAGNNAQGTGIPLVAGGWTYGGTGDIQIAFTYETAA